MNAKKAKLVRQILNLLTGDDPNQVRHSYQEVTSRRKFIRVEHPDGEPEKFSFSSAPGAPTATINPEKKYKKIQVADGQKINAPGTWRGRYRALKKSTRNTPTEKLRRVFTELRAKKAASENITLPPGQDLKIEIA